MGPDRMSSCRDSFGYTSRFSSFTPAQPERKIVPFSEDILEAIKSGDRDAIEKLLGRESPKGAELLWKQFKNGIEWIFFAPFHVFRKKIGKIGNKIADPLEQRQANLEKFISSYKQQLLRIITSLANQLFQYFNQRNSFLLNRMKGLEKPFRVIQSVLNHAMSTSHQLFLKIIHPVDRWVQSNSEVLAIMLKFQAERLQEHSLNALKWLNRKTKPFQKQVIQKGEEIAQTLDGARKWLKEKGKNLYLSVAQGLDKVHEKGKKLEARTLEILTQVKHHITPYCDLIIQPFRNLPEIVAPFAFWLSKHSATPVGNIKENIARWVNQSKKGVEWVAIKIIAVGYILNKAAIQVGKRFAQLAQWIRKEFKAKLIPFALFIVGRLALFYTSLFRRLWKIFWWLVKAILAIAYVIFTSIKGVWKGSRKLLVEGKERLVK